MTLELTQKIPHPAFPAFITTIRFVSRADVIKRSVEIQNSQVPVAVIDPRTGDVFIQKNGEPLVQWKVVNPASAIADGVLRYVVGFEGYPFDGLTFDPKTAAGLLMDERLDVDVVEQLTDARGALLVNEDGTPKMGPVKKAWTRRLGDLAMIRETFVPGFTSTHSEAP